MRLGTALLAIAALSSTAGLALGQGKSAPKAPATASAKPKASAMPSAAPAAAPSPLPAGHPQVENPAPPAMPPPLGDEDPEDDDSVPSPRGQAPHGQQGGSRDGTFDAPPDTSEDDPALPAGTIAIAVLDAKGSPVPRSPLTLAILQSTVAKGESSSRLGRDADDRGAARFDGLQVGSSVTYTVSTTRGSATYASPPFSLSDKAGKRITLHAYEVSGRIDDVLVGMQGVVYIGLKEDSVSIEQLFSIFNVGPVAWEPHDLVLELPEGFKAFSKQDAPEDCRFDEVPGKGVALRGTVAPGRHELSFRYTVSLDQESRQAFRVGMPPHVAQLRVMTEASKTMGLEVAGFPAAQRTQTPDGKHLLVTERQAARAEGGIHDVEITMTGLPTPGPGRWIAVGLGVLALVSGGSYVLRRRDDAELSEEARRDLREARDALLDEIVALERARRAGEVGPKTYPRLRAALLDALARVVTMLGETKRPRGYRGPQESSRSPT